MTDDERDYKDWLQSREIDTALATIEAAQDEYDAMVHRLNDALADRDRLAARCRELEAALTAFVEAEDINRQYDGTYDSPPGHVVAEMYERAAAMARAALADSGAAEQEA